MISIIGVIVALALLVLLAFKKWNMFLVSLICAVLVGITSQMNFWSIFNDCYMPGFVKFFSSWFLIFTIGAVYSEFMSQSGSVSAIAYKLIRLFGKNQLLLVMLVVSLLLNLGGVNVYVQIFIFWPMAVVLSRESGIHRGVWLSVFYLGFFSSLLFPGSPGMVNTVAAQLLNVSVTTAPVLCVIMFLCYLIPGYFIIAVTEKRWRKKGKVYAETNADRNIVEPDNSDLPGIFKALIPLALVILLYTSLSSGWFSVFGLAPMPANSSILTAMGLATLVCYLLNFKKLHGKTKSMVFKSVMGGITPTFSAAVIAGFLGVVSASQGYFLFAEAVQAGSLSPYLQCCLVGNVLGFLTGGGAVTAQAMLGTFGKSWLANPAVDVGIMREMVVANASGGITLSPHSGGLHGVMGYAGTDLKESYPLCVISVLIPSVVINIVFSIIVTFL